MINYSVYMTNMLPSINILLVSLSVESIARTNILQLAATDEIQFTIISEDDLC